MIGPTGPINLLFILPHNEIVSAGIPYVRSKALQGKTQFDDFWNRYFIKIWMEQYGPSTENIYGINQDLLINRTNNPMERYNRKFNHAFPKIPSKSG